MDVIEELGREIHDFIECKYKCCFKGKATVIKDFDEYCLWLTLDNWMTPLQICYLTDDEEEFLEYIKKELSKRHLARVGFFKLVMEHGKTEKR